MVLDGKEPIVYRADIDVRFGDLDPYGHVNSMRYLDFVTSSRWLYLSRQMNISADELIRKGLGFYLVKSSMEYLRPVLGAARVTVDSHVSAVRDTRLDVPYEIRSEDGKVVHSRGLLEFAVIDLNTRRPQALPEWAVSLFFND